MKKLGLEINKVAILLIALCAGNGLNLSAAEALQLVSRTYTVSESGSAAGHTLVAPAARVSFLPPTGWKVRLDAALQQVILTPLDSSTSITLKLQEPVTGSGSSAGPRRSDDDDDDGDNNRGKSVQKRGDDDDDGDRSDRGNHYGQIANGKDSKADKKVIKEITDTKKVSKKIEKDAKEAAKDAKKDAKEAAKDAKKDAKAVDPLETTHTVVPGGKAGAISSSGSSNSGSGSGSSRNSGKGSGSNSKTLGLDPKNLELQRKEVLAEFPDAIVTSDAVRYSSGHKGYAYDVDRVVKAGKAMAVRVAFLEHANGRVGVKLMAPKASFQSALLDYGNVLNSIKIE